ncbi:MAG: serine hydrolase [Verrucomicrobia bacterium]|nr:serine hydrolase [Verrucomicrobiota bacterium]
MNLRPFALSALVTWLTTVPLFAANPAATPIKPEVIPVHPQLQTLVNEAAQTALTEFAGKGLQTNHLAITLVDLTDKAQPTQASFRGDARIYPASVIKLFYLAAAHRWLEDGKLQDTDELRRAMRDMIVDSCNEATHYVIDVLTDTTGGPELPSAEMTAWADKRNTVNRYFASIGYTNINANQKTWNEGPYGRERVFVGKNYDNRNALTTDATARLLSDIVLGRCISAPRSAEMLKLMERNPFKKVPDEGEPDQGTAFTGRALKPSAKLWSKAGWTSTTRHDAAYVELPNGVRFVLVIFTTNHANEREIIPTVARKVIEGLEKGHGAGK